MARLTILSPADTAEAVSVLCDAFQDYPVMRYVLGANGGYERRLRTLIEFFVAARVLRDEPVLAVREPGGTVAAVALVSLSGERPLPPALEIRREATWWELGAAERGRYETYSRITQQFEMEASHYHLNLIGVRRACVGQGFGRQLLSEVHRLSQADGLSCGVTLTTETAQNVPLYQHFGYRLLGEARVSDELQTWAFFRPDSRGD